MGDWLKGGINLNPNELNISVDHDGKGFVLPILGLVGEALEDQQLSQIKI